MWGIDRLSGGRHSFVRKRLRNGTTAVLTHSAALDRRGRSTLDVLDELGVVPSILFSPEHGLDGVAQAEEAVPSLAHRPAAVDDVSGVPSDRGLPSVVSLYGSDKESLSPKDEHFAGINNLVIDLVDVGSRYYTYVWTALIAARKAASLGVHTVILDRPNPIGCDPSQLEGKPQSAGYLSFVGLEPIAIRHGLTIGELLTHCLVRDGLTPGPDGAFSLVACKGWERYRTQLAWGRPFIPPSPNMPTLETAQLYPGACLVEGTNLSEGRGTANPFRVVGAPFLDGTRLAKELEALHLPGVMLRPVAFKPSFEKHAGQVCHGVMLHITNAATFRPVATYLSLLTLARAQNAELFGFRTQAYEFESERLAFDLLTGSSEAREAIVNGATAKDVSALICPVGPEVTELWNALQDDLARACSQPNVSAGQSLQPGTTAYPPEQGSAPQRAAVHEEPSAPDEAAAPASDEAPAPDEAAASAPEEAPLPTPNEAPAREQDAPLAAPDEAPMPEQDAPLPAPDEAPMPEEASSPDAE